MTDDSSVFWRARVEQLFHDALSLPAEGRRAFLVESCGGDEGLCREVESLLAQHDAARDFLESPAPMPPPAALDDGGMTLRTTSGIEPPGDCSPMPERIGQYRILRRLGAGGMGVVYVAEQDHPRREVAIKVIRAGVASRQSIRRFEYEARILGRLQHPCIAQIYEAGVFGANDDARPYFAMECVRGLALNDFVRRSQPSLGDRLSLFVQICDAVHHAHLKGVIHRDLKPGNILIDADGRPRILDFGVARVTDEDIRTTTMRTDVGQLIGTVPYMSPEQVAGIPEDVDLRSDVYALGVLLFELLSGRLPYDLDRKTIPEAARIIRDVEPSRLASIDRSLRGDLETIAMKALEKDKSRRYQTVADLADDVRRHLRDEPIAARPPSAAYICRKFARRHKALVAGVAVAAMAIVVGVAATAAQAVRATQAERLALRRADDAERSAAAARAVTDFLTQDILALASPTRSSDRGMSIREALDIAAASVAQRSFESEEISAAVRQAIGRAYRELALFEEAAPHLEAAASALSRERPDSAERWTAEFEAAANEAMTGDAAAARPRFAAILERVDRDDFPDERARLYILAGYSSYYNILGVSARDAAEICRRALAGQQELLGEEHPETLKTMSVLSGMAAELGQTDEALALAESVLQARRALLGDDHYETILSLGVVGSRQRNAGALSSAQATFLESLERADRVIGRDSHTARFMRRSLAGVYRDSGRVDAAIEMLRELEAAHPADQTDTEAVHACNDLAQALAAAGDTEEALQLQRRAWALYEQEFGPSHPYSLTARLNLAEFERRLAQWDAAESDARESLRLASEAHGELDGHALRAQYLLAWILVAKGDDARAEPELVRLVTMCEAAYGPTHAQSRSSLLFLASARQRLGNLSAAAADFEQLVSRCREAVGDTHADTLQARFGAAEAHLARNDLAAAEPHTAECLRIALAVLPPDSAQVVRLFQQRARVLMGLERHQEAAAMIRDAHASLNAVGGDQAPNAIALAEMAAQVYDDWHRVSPEAGHDREAQTWRARATPAAEAPPVSPQSAGSNSG